MCEISEIEIKAVTKEQIYMRGYADGELDTLDNIRAIFNDYDDTDLVKVKFYDS